MSSNGKVEAATVAIEQPAQKRVVKEKKPKAEKVVKEKVVKEKKPKAEKVVKEKVVKEKKPKEPKKTSHPSHPPYFQMIKEALMALNEKGGSSPYAIAKYMEEKHKAILPGNFKKMLGLQLKNSAAKGKLIKVKASYKLSEAGKKEAKKTKKVEKASKPKPKDAAAKPKPKDAAAKPKKVEKAKKVVKKKVVGGKKPKKATPAKAKQPKSIKSPVAKKAKKGA